MRWDPNWRNDAARPETRVTWISTITGAAATATHGTGGAFQNLSADVSPAGHRGREVLSLSEGDDTWRHGLPALGGSQVTLQTVPLFTLHRHDQRRRFGADGAPRRSSWTVMTISSFLFPYGR